MSICFGFEMTIENIKNEGEHTYTQNWSIKCTMYRICTHCTEHIQNSCCYFKWQKKNLTIHPTDGDKVKAIELCQCLSFLRSRSWFLGDCIISSGGLLKLFHFDMFEKKKKIPGFLFTMISSQLNSSFNFISLEQYFFVIRLKIVFIFCVPSTSFCFSLHQFQTLIHLVYVWKSFFNCCLSAEDVAGWLESTKYVCWNQR